MQERRGNGRKEKGEAGREDEGGGEIPKQEAFLFEESAVAQTENESHVDRDDINHFSSS